MIAMISPGLASCENTLNTLRYADRVKEMKKGAPKAVAGGLAPSAMDMGGAGSDLEMEDEEDGGWLGEPTPLEASLVKQDIAKLHQSIMKGKGKSTKQTDADNVADAAQFTFQSAVAEVVEAEERVVEEHRAWVEADKSFIAQEEKLLRDVDTVDFDADNYARRLDELLDAKMAKLQSLKANVQQFRKHLQDEEKASKAVKSGMKF